MKKQLRATAPKATTTAQTPRFTITKNELIDLANACRDLIDGNIGGPRKRSWSYAGVLKKWKVERAKYEKDPVGPGYADKTREDALSTRDFIDEKAAMLERLLPQLNARFSTKPQPLTLTIPAKYVEKFTALLDWLSIPRDQMVPLLMESITANEPAEEWDVWKDSYIYPSRDAALQAAKKMWRNGHEWNVTIGFYDKKGEYDTEKFIRPVQAVA